MMDMDNLKDGEVVDDNDLFMIDKKPTSWNSRYTFQVTKYKCTADVLDEQTEARKKLKAGGAGHKCARPKPQFSCFNCGKAGHAMRECRKPRNNARIQRARQENVGRYHEHAAASKKFEHIKPGKISTKTRHALGYGRNELPFFNYRLRVLGYPPAWLEAAKVHSSGINLYNADGTKDENRQSDTFKYDINQIVEFPGFNVKPSGQIFDDFQRHNVPPFQPGQSKANFIKSLGENVTSENIRKKQTSFGDCDMEVVDEAEDPSSDDDAGRSPSPSLDDLRARRAKLIRELIALDGTVKLEEKPEAVGAADIKQTPALPKSIKATFEGAPVVKFSVDKLPDGNYFKVGLSDAITFGNLPGSTGKYDQMKGLLKNVRKKMTRLQSKKFKYRT